MGGEEGQQVLDLGELVQLLEGFVGLMVVGQLVQHVVLACHGEVVVGQLLQLLLLEGGDEGGWLDGILHEHVVGVEGESWLLLQQSFPQAHVWQQRVFHGDGAGLAHFWDSGVVEEEAAVGDQDQHEVSPMLVQHDP